MPSIRELYLADQKDRSDSYKLPKDEQRAFEIQAQRRDQHRLQQVREALHAKQVQTGEDLFCAAMIFQHGLDTCDFAMAHLLALQAHELGFNALEVMNFGPHPLWVAAAARDRWLVNMGLPQDFGTQMHTLPDGTKERAPVNPDITNEERARWHVDPLDDDFS